MTDDLLTPGAITAAGGAIVAIGRWGLRLWADVRREGFVIDQAKTEQQRKDNDRMVDALLEQAKSNATLAGAHALLAKQIDQLSTKLDGIAERSEWTPVGGHRTYETPRGYEQADAPPSLDSERRRQTRERAPGGYGAVPVPEPLPETAPSAPYHFSPRKR